MGVHRTWFDTASADKAPVAYPRRAMGHLLGHGVHFGVSSSMMAAREGIETMLSLREVAPALPVIAGQSAAHLAAIIFRSGLHRLYVARENDRAGLAAFATNVERAISIGIEILALAQLANDFNSDLMTFGRASMASIIASQFRPDDFARYLN